MSYFVTVADWQGVSLRPRAPSKLHDYLQSTADMLGIASTPVHYQSKKYQPGKYQPGHAHNAFAPSFAEAGQSVAIAIASNARQHKLVEKPEDGELIGNGAVIAEGFGAGIALQAIPTIARLGYQLPALLLIDPVIDPTATLLEMAAYEQTSLDQLTALLADKSEFMPLKIGASNELTVFGKKHFADPAYKNILQHEEGTPRWYRELGQKLLPPIYVIATPGYEDATTKTIAAFQENLPSVLRPDLSDNSEGQNKLIRCETMAHIFTEDEKAYADENFLKSAIERMAIELVDDQLEPRRKTAYKRWEREDPSPR